MQEMMAMLSARELTVFKLLSHGKKSKEIAQQLGISVATVSKHRSNIKEKVGVSAKEILLLDLPGVER